MIRKTLRTSLTLLTVILTVASLSGCGAVAKIIAAGNAANSQQQEETDTDTEKEETEKTSKKKKKKTGLKKKKDTEETEVTEDIYKEDPDKVFLEMSDWSFIFSSGAGGWGTELFVNPDGTFTGHYSDSDMGDTGNGYSNGTVYVCNFSGKFSRNVKAAGPLMHSLSIESMKYENEPDTEEIVDDIRYIYTTPYGLEDVEGRSEDDPALVFMEAGAVTSAINEEEMSWVSSTHFGTYVGSDWDYVEDTPEELPYAVLINTAKSYAFFSENISEKNKVFLINKVKLPGLKNTELSIYDDGTYYCVDENEDRSFRVINTCYASSKIFDDYNNAPELVNDAINVIYGRSAPSQKDVYVTAPKDAYEMIYPKMAVNGYHSDYALWYPDGDKNTSCIGRFLVQGGYESDTSYVYAYIIETKNRADAYPDDAMQDPYINSLTLTGKRDGLSSSAEGEGAVRSILTEMQTPEGDYVSAMEALMVTERDKDLIKKYHLEDAEFMDDYEMVFPDNKFHEYKLAYGDETPFYVQYPTDNYQTLNLAYQLEDYYGVPASEDSTRLFQLYLDKNDEVLYGFEVYTP